MLEEITKKRLRTLRAPAIVLTFFGLYCGAAQGQQEFEGKTVMSVSYEPVRQPIDPRDLVRMQLTETGKPLDLRQVALTIDHLFASGYYDDIQVDAEPSGAGVALRFVTKARLFVGHVDAAGKISDPPNRGVITSDAQLYLGTPYVPADVDTAQRSIRQIMKDNGLYAGDVGTATITDSATNEVTIRIVVNAGKRAKYTDPLIQGDTKLSNSAIIRATGWRIPLVHRWRQVTAPLTDKGTESISSKYAKKDRLTAQVDVKSLQYDEAKNTLKPTLAINAGPVIDIRAVEAKLKKSALRSLVPVYTEGSVDNDLLNEGAHNIHDYFQSRGYPDVEVTFDPGPVKNDRQLIKYLIALGPRRRLVHIDVVGSNYFTQETLRERLFLQTKSIVLRYGRYSETFRHSDEDALASLYQSNGFRNVKVTSAIESDYKGKESDLGATFHITEGPQWKISKLTIDGVRQLDLAPIHDQLYSVEWQPYADVNVASDRNRIIQYYFDHGFLHAGFRYQTTISPSVPNAVELTYTVREGEQEFVRGVIMSGLNRTKPALVSKLVTLKDGDPVSMARINDISRQLTDLGVFASVNSAMQDPDGNAAYKYVLYDFDEAARYTFNIGGGLEVGQFGQTTTNLSNSGGSQGASPIISFNVNRLNLFGIGQTLSLQTKYSSLEQRDSLNYIVPRFLGSERRTVTFSILYDTTQDVQTFASKREQASVTTSQRLSRASTLQLRYDYRRVSTSSVNIPSLLVPSLLQPVRIGIFSASYIQDHRDNPADAHHGFWNTIDTGIASGYLGSQRSFGRALARNATYTAIGHRFVLARQTQLGAITPFNIQKGFTSYDVIPLPERFFGGGGVSMRGFGDNQAGPRDIGAAAGPGSLPSVGTGFPIGGDALFFNNVELRFPLLGPNISGVFFHDMGNIYSRLSDISFKYAQSSSINATTGKTEYQDFNYAVQAIGFGIRYKTPLGPVRVDLSYALNPPHYQGFSTSETTQDLLQCGPGTIGVTKPCTPGSQQLAHFNFFFSIGQAF